MIFYWQAKSCSHSTGFCLETLFLRLSIFCISIFAFLINRELSNFTMAINFTFLLRDYLHNFFSHSEVIQWRFSLENKNFPRSKFQPTQRSSKIVLKKQKSVLFVLHSTRLALVLVASYFFLTVFIPLIALPLKVCGRRMYLQTQLMCNNIITNINNLISIYAPMCNLRLLKVILSSVIQLSSLQKSTKRHNKISSCNM